MFTKKKHMNVVKSSVSFPKHYYALSGISFLNTFANNLICNYMHIHKCNEYISYT